MLLINWQNISFGPYFMIYVNSRVMDGWREGEKVIEGRDREYRENVAITKNNVGRLSFWTIGSTF